MPLKLALLEEEDISAFVQVDDAAMKDWGLAKAMEKSNHSGKPRIKLIEGYMRAGFEQNSECVFLKVTDTDTGKLIAGGQWTFNFEGKKEETTEQAPASKVMQNATDVTAEMSRMGKEFMKEFVGSKPYANLNILVAHPDHQRRGAGSMLIQYGCDIADQRGILGVLTASAAGESLYKKHGFEIVQVTPLDLRPYGVEETEMRRRMIRQPKRKAT